MKSFALYFHGGSGNRGCEAIVRTTSAMIRKNFDKSAINLYSFRTQEDEQLCPDFADNVYDMSTDSRANVCSSVKDKLMLKLLNLSSYKKSDEFYFGKYFDANLPLDEDVFISIGGDNYCYGDNTSFNAFNKLLKKKGKKTVLWGCSVDEGSFSDYTLEDLRRYDSIFVRETMSEKLFHEHGIKENVFLHPDPAFTLPVEKVSLPDNFKVKQTVGINISPLIMKYESSDNEGSGFASVKKLCEYILEKTPYDIAFIPHVYWESSCDLEPLNELQKLFSDSSRTVIFDKPLSAPQLKGVISQCCFYIGARTHSTIAAYSTCVPTLVLGYSIKSKGIATDLFGSYDGFVIPIQSIKDTNSLADGFENMMKNENKIKTVLETKMPSYISQAFDAGKKLYSIYH